VAEIIAGEDARALAAHDSPSADTAPSGRPPKSSIGAQSAPSSDVHLVTAHGGRSRGPSGDFSSALSPPSRVDLPAEPVDRARRPCAVGIVEPDAEHL
jgi:hypothetical protein